MGSKGSMGSKWSMRSKGSIASMASIAWQNNFGSLQNMSIKVGVWNLYFRKYIFHFLPKMIISYWNLKSRAKSRRDLDSDEIHKRLAANGICVKVASPKLIMEEAPESYKDVVQVIETCDIANISKKAIKLKPLAVIKGWLRAAQNHCFGNFNIR